MLLDGSAEGDPSLLLGQTHAFFDGIVQQVDAYGDQIRIADGQRLRHHHLHMDIDVLFLRAADLGVQDGVDDLVLAVSVLSQLLAIPQQPGHD